jgi:hypothetical protein
MLARVQGYESGASVTLFPWTEALARGEQRGEKEVEWPTANHTRRSVFRLHASPPIHAQVFTNPASWTEEGVMRVAHHHSHSCSTCHVNLCKREVLELYTKG